MSYPARDMDHVAMQQHMPASCSSYLDLASAVRSSARQGGPAYSSLTDFDEKVELHRGRHSTVWSARCRRSGCVVVVKAYMRHKLKPRQLLNVQREITLLRLFSQSGCPGVVKLLAHFEDKDSVFLVCEACMRGDLYQTLLKSKGSLSEDYVCKKVVVPLLGILNQTHKLSIVHRDIKPENIFITLAGDIQLGDFGLAVHKQQDNLTERVGTLDYMAPEVLAMPTPDEMANKGKKPAKVPYDEKVDIWAVGILVYELLVGRPPFEVEDPKETAQLILAAKIESFPPGLSPLAVGFMRLALAKNPAERPAAGELMQHAWVKAHVREADMPSPCTKTLKQMLEASCCSGLQQHLSADGKNLNVDSPSHLVKIVSPRKALSTGDDPFLLEKPVMPLPPKRARGVMACAAASVLSPVVAVVAAVLGGGGARVSCDELKPPVAPRAHSVAVMVAPLGSNAPLLIAKSLGGGPSVAGGPGHLHLHVSGATGRRASSGTSEFLTDSPTRVSSPNGSVDGSAPMSPVDTAHLMVTAAAVAAASSSSNLTLVAPRAMSMACMSSVGDHDALIASMAAGGVAAASPPAAAVSPAADLGVPAYSRSFTAKCRPAAKSRFA